MNLSYFYYKFILVLSIIYSIYLESMNISGIISDIEIDIDHISGMVLCDTNYQRREFERQLELDLRPSGMRSPGYSVNMTVSNKSDYIQRNILEALEATPDDDIPELFDHSDSEDELQHISSDEELAINNTQFILTDEELTSEPAIIESLLGKAHKVLRDHHNKKRENINPNSDNFKVNYYYLEYITVIIKNYYYKYTKHIQPLVKFYRHVIRKYNPRTQLGYAGNGVSVSGPVISGNNNPNHSLNNNHITF